MITLSLNSSLIQQRLREIERATGNLTPVLKVMGEYMQGATEERFRTSTAPDGSRWKGNSPVTMATYLAGRSGTRKRNGELSARGNRLQASKKPLIGHGGWSGGLAGQIRYQVFGQTVYIGSSKAYAAMMQFGGRRATYPNLWGDIPARPFLGFSSADEGELVQLMTEHLRAALP